MPQHPSVAVGIPIQSSVYPYNESLPSLESTSITDSLAELSSDGTTTTSATVPGLGVISGRAILALGNFTLRGAEYVIIRRRLNTIASNFPHRNTCHIQGIDQMYRDILELSRRGLYHDTIRTRALTIILVQVGSRQTQQLIKCLLHWPPIEIKIFITELTTILHPFQLKFVQGPGEQPTLIRAYAKSLAPWEGHSFEPFIVFLQRLVEKNNTIGGAILEGGGMDYLLRLYAFDFSDPLTIKEPWDFHRRSTLYAACNSLLLIVSSSPQGLSSIRKHQFHILWSARPELPFTPPAHDRVVQRAQIWASLDKEIVFWRIRSMMAMMQDWRRPFEQELLMDIAIDVLDFSGSENMEPDIHFRALRALRRFLLCGKSSAREAVCQYMTISNPEYFSEVMSRIISRISKLM
ncbi:hypothetical protein BDZ94DRAFT_95506 [Collybia nuda]|uniref:Uncharacterized protein n=1 Tax=Collybia nuda TaxID=64659 RepID=A0A9P5YFN0_9AGAR|nr:hypothetical protein BDZ94DRAFT_95506 [Collybia nuda]